MEATENSPRNRGSYFVITGDVKEFSTPQELKKHIAENGHDEGVILKGREVNVKIINKPVVSLEN